MRIYRVFAGNDGESHIKELKLEEHPELGALTNLSEVKVQQFRALTVVDDFSRECPAITVDTSISGQRVTRVLEELAEVTGLPEVIVMDNGPEFTRKAMLCWAQQRGVKLHFIDPGKPTQNAYIESFNGKFRDECLNQNWFSDLQEARRMIEEWRRDYNLARPHNSLGYLTPETFRQKHELSLSVV